MDTDLLHAADRADGSLTAVFSGVDGIVVLRVDIDEGTDHVDELFLRYLVGLVADVGLAAVRFLVSRRDGRPTRVDRLLSRELAHRLASGETELQDVAVVGLDQWWSATSGRVTPLVRAA